MSVVIRVSCDFNVEVPDFDPEDHDGVDNAASQLASELRCDELWEQADFGTPEDDKIDFVLGEDGMLLRKRD